MFIDSIQTDGQLNQACNPHQNNDIVITKRGNYLKTASSFKSNWALNSNNDAERLFVLGTFLNGDTIVLGQ